MVANTAPAHSIKGDLSLLRLSLAAACLLFLACPKSPEENEPTVSDFSLEDINPNSSTYLQLIGPSSYKGDVSAFYFGDQG